MTKVISVAALISAMATASFAGNLNTVEVPQVNNDVFVAAPSSAGLAVPLAVAGGLLAIGLIASNSDDDDDAAPTSTPVED